MVPLRSAKQESIGLVKPLLTFIDSLPSRISHLGTPTTSVEIATLQLELNSHISTLRSSSQIIACKVNAIDWQKKGTEIWNLSTRISRTICEGKDDDDTIATATTRIYGPLRAFAFLLLDCAYRARRKADSPQNRQDLRHDLIRLFRNANKAAKTCLQTVQLDLCTAISERAADLDIELSKKSQDGAVGQDEDQRHSTDDHTEYRRLQMDYCALRIVLAFKQDNVDLAESMFLRIEDELKSNVLEPARAEELSDLMFEVGKGFGKKSEHKRAAKWLDRSLQILSTQDSDMLSPDAGELKLSVMNYLTRALLQLNNPEALLKARDLVDALEKTYDDKMVVAILRLDLLLAEDALDVEQFSAVLSRLLRIVHLTNVNCNTVMAYIHKLRERSPANACKTLDDFLMLRLIVDQKTDWAQKVIIVRLWMSIENLDADDPRVLEEVQLILNCFLNRFGKPFDAGATHAAHVLIWKRIKAKHKGGQYEEAEKWAQLGLHQIFSNAGEYNMAVLRRRTLLCQLDRQNLDSARTTIQELPEPAKSIPLTCFLIYKFAVRSHDFELASQCLDVISRQTSQDANLLYACVLEAQASSDKTSAIAVLRKVLVSQDHNVANGAHVPTLLRCLIRLLQSDLPVANKRDDRSIGRQLCEAFETAASHISQKTHGAKSRVLDQFSQDELHWFMMHSYNLGHQYYGEWPWERSLRMLETCIEFIKAATLSSEVEQEALVDWRRRSATCHVLVINALTKLARAEDEQEVKLRHYRRVQYHLTTFSNLQIPQTDLEGKLACKLVKCHYEAAVHLEDWESLPSVASACGVFKDQKLSREIVDMTLSITGNVPAASQLRVLEIMVAATNAQNDPATLSRWLHSAYRICAQDCSQQDRFDGVDQAESLAKQETILAHALSLAKLWLPRPVTTEPHYPAEEIEYFATVTFNRAIDAYCASDDETCQRLADQAIEFAECLQNVDGGALREALVERKASLTPACAGDVEDN